MTKEAADSPRNPPSGACAFFHKPLIFAGSGGYAVVTTSDDQSDESKEVQPAPAAGEVLGRAMNIAVSGFFFGFLGHWIGTKVGAADLLAVIGAFIGAAAGFYSLYAHVTARTKQDRKSKAP
jgi:hypothetical protein